MRKRTLCIWVVVLASLSFWAASQALGQEAETSGKAAAAEPAQPAVAYRLDYLINEMEDGKKINNREYSMNLDAGDANAIKIGSRVPVDVKNGEFQYLDIGTNIWSRLRERGSSLTLEVRADFSSVAADQQAQPYRPVVRQVQINASTVVLLGKSMVVGAVDDPTSKRQFQLEVTVTKLR